MIIDKEVVIPFESDIDNISTKKMDSIIHLNRLREKLWKVYITEAQ